MNTLKCPLAINFGLYITAMIICPLHYTIMFWMFMKNMPCSCVTESYRTFQIFKVKSINQQYLSQLQYRGEYQTAFCHNRKALCSANTSNQIRHIQFNLESVSFN